MSFIENANFIMTAAKNTRKIIGLITIAFLYSGCSSDKTVVSDTVNDASEIDSSNSDNGKNAPISKRNHPAQSLWAIFKEYSLTFHWPDQSASSEYLRIEGLISIGIEEQERAL